MKVAIATVLYLEWHRAKQLTRRSIKPEVKRWWTQQRLHGLCEAVCQHAEKRELKFLSDRPKTSGDIAKLKRLLQYGSPNEYRINRRNSTKYRNFKKRKRGNCAEFRAYASGYE